MVIAEKTNGDFAILSQLDNARDILVCPIRGGEVLELWVLPWISGGLCCALWCVLQPVREIRWGQTPALSSAEIWGSLCSSWPAGFACGLLCVVLYFVVRLRDYLIFIVQIYQRISPESVRRRCLFYPTCSTYMIFCLHTHGALQGCYKGLRRILRCREEACESLHHP